MCSPSLCGTTGDGLCNPYNSVVFLSNLGAQRSYANYRQETDKPDVTSTTHGRFVDRISVSFRKMECRTWYIIHNQIQSWSCRGQRGNIEKDIGLRQTFVTGLETIFLESTPRPLTRLGEVEGSSDQELREYSLFA